MSQRNSNDWSVFGLPGDPVPGDVSQIANIGHMLTARETSAYEVSVGVEALCTDPSVDAWLGDSGQAFRTTLDPLPGLLRQLVDAYREATAAMVEYAAAVGKSQSTADRAYQQRVAAINDWSAKNGGRRPDLVSGGASLDGWVVAPEGVDVQGWYQQQADIAETAIPAHRSASAACLKALQVADSALNRVQAALGDPSFKDFNAQFIHNGGALIDLTWPDSPMELMGSALYTAQVNDLKTALAGGKTAADPDVIRAELKQLTGEYQDESGFWHQFAPLLGTIPGWLQQHPGSSDGADGLLLSTIGARMAGAASDGSLDALDLTTGASTASLIGLSKLLETTTGQQYQPPKGSEFLAILARSYINHEDGLAPIDRADFGPALTAALNLAASNVDAARAVMAGPDGVELATKLLQGSASITYLIGGRPSSQWHTTVAYTGVDPNAIAAFLDAAKMPIDPAHPELRTTGDADLQRVLAAHNVASAAAEFDSWAPPKVGFEDPKKIGLPSEITTSLAGYAKDFSYDLAVSVSDDNPGGIIATVDGVPGGQPIFELTDQNARAFLKVALSDPDAASKFKGIAVARYQDAVKVALMSNGDLDHTQGYAKLVAASQQIIDKMDLSAAQHKDAVAAEHAALVDALLGGMGNAPSGTAGGLAQAIGGLLTPYIDAHLGTTYADEAAAANHQADLLISSRADVLVTQAALDAGKLTIGTDRKTQIPIGITDGHGRVVGNGQFRTWYTGTGGTRWGGCSRCAT
ncbi:MAG: hypothetical protein AUG49_12725 [Catenulispora sp. 13_1_20CM_3_70_7]|nr:MAG: hypothetical protein AUG49_12725 [Catenulispora sp. 13_1_20CM_3_70_7]